MIVEIGGSNTDISFQLSHVAACHFICDSGEAFDNAFLPHIEELQADIINYTNVRPIVRISEIELADFSGMI
ncbi:MAG: EthD family reductase [Methylovirgula sp.]